MSAAPAGRRPKQTTLDPRALDVGNIAGQVATKDRYFKLGDDVLTLIVRAMVDRLPEPDRSCVEMTVMHRMPYAEAGEVLGPWLGRGKPVDPRTVWRWARRGVETMQQSLADAPWAAELLVGRLPEPPPSTVGPRAFQDVLNQQGGSADGIQGAGEQTDAHGGAGGGDAGDDRPAG